ncbi:PEP-utilizing enzyme [Streptomyces caeni]|uniref:PEP-utilizing enzyme n=1 Tax=Streptomyces caeni TaxID=2307231 RepID=A0ABW4IQ39_9ACTN
MPGSLSTPTDSTAEFADTECYPGFRPEYAESAYAVEPFRPFGKEDESRFWFLDFHWPRGLTPLGLLANQDGYSWASQLAAECLPLPGSRGITQRLVGTHTYASAIQVPSEFERRARATRLRAGLNRFLDEFPGIWAAREDEIDQWWQRLRSIDPARLDTAELVGHLGEARRFHRRAFEIHFEVMYPLLANHVAFRRLCDSLGVDPALVGVLLQGEHTKVMETDRALWELAGAARRAGLAAARLTAAPGDRVLAGLAAAGGAQARWASRFGDFLQVYGHRTEGTSDVALPSWLEDPSPALGMIASFLQLPAEHDFDAELTRAREQRDAAADEVRGRLTGREQRVFDSALASCRAANLPKWQDDHNVSIDLRVALPLRRASLEIAERAGADRRDDAMFLFWPELVAVAEGRSAYPALRGLVGERRDYFERWRARRSSLPKALGTVPDEDAHDPVLAEVFGIDRTFLGNIRAAATRTVSRLTGVPAARGTARGRARVLTDAEALHRLRPGDVLVCESTSPNWTPAFAVIAACVCDAGGILSHAAIVGREYGVPTVTAVGTATHAIRDGDEVEVDGTHGTVRVLRR